MALTEYEQERGGTAGAGSTAEGEFGVSVQISPWLQYQGEQVDQPMVSRVLDSASGTTTSYPRVAVVDFKDEWDISEIRAKYKADRCFDLDHDKRTNENELRGGRFMYYVKREPARNDFYFFYSEFY